MASPIRPSPLSFDSGRQSPFKRQNSVSPATVRATTPTQSPTKTGPSFSHTRAGSLSPEKTSPFVRRPSQINHSSERPSSPFARPSSSLSIPTSPSRQASNASRSDETPPASPSRQTSVAPDESDEASTPSAATARPPPSPFDGTASPAASSPSYPFPNQTNLRPTFNRTATSSTTSTIKQPTFIATTIPRAAAPPAPKLTNNIGGYHNIPQPLLRSMCESFEVLDTSNSGSITSSSVASMLEQLGLASTSTELKTFFPPSGGPQQMNLARYLDTLSGPLAELSQPEELLAAFGAFDVDDSGQIDVAELKRALAEEGEMSEREVESVLAEFSGRRAFGAKGTHVAKGKGEVFRYREFMGAVGGGNGGDAGLGGEVVVV